MGTGIVVVENRLFEVLFEGWTVGKVAGIEIPILDELVGSLDDAVGERDVLLSDDLPNGKRVFGEEILGTSVGDESNQMRGAVVAEVEAVKGFLNGFEAECSRCFVRDAPREDEAGEIVDEEINGILAVVERAEKGNVGVKKFTRPVYADVDRAVFPAVAR